MKNKKYTYPFLLKFLIIGITVLVSIGFLGEDRTGNKKMSSKVYKPSGITQSGKQGEAYRLNINNINLPMNNSGVLADVNIPPNGTLGRFDGIGFLFSSGFFLSGFSGNRLWSNAVATASLVGDYLPGTVAGGGDPVMYVVKGTDAPGSQAYIDWADAVALGADFYDVDGDGIYDPMVDHPDLLGDETVWCVYNDGVAGSVRRWTGVEPIGIEVRQTAFALNSKGAIGNIIFLRYRIKYVGLGNPSEPDRLTDVYFGKWADPDIGANYQEDLVGSDVPRNAIFTYKNGPDGQYGVNPPAYFSTFFSGPIEYIPGETFIDNNGNGEYDEGVDEPLDTAYSVRGQKIGKIAFPGARNQPLSSVIEYINGLQDFNDPSDHIQARNYMLGLRRDGGDVDPCTLPIGNGPFDGCDVVDPRFWFSGDPVTGTGWLCTAPNDVRQMANTGPFTLWKDTEENREAGRLIEKEIIVAYVVGRGTDRLNSITVARQINDISQQIFDNNFPSPPAPNPVVYETKSGPDFIDITFQTSDPAESDRYGVNYRALDTVLDIDRRLQGYYITAFRTRSTEQSINGITNAMEIANYSIHSVDTIKNIYFEAQNGGIDLRRAIAPDNHLLDSTIYGDSEQGRIRFTLREDPFTGGPLVKGKEYYFAITQYTLNHTSIVNRETGTYGPSGDYLEIGSAYEEFDQLNPISRQDQINQLGTRMIRVIFGEDIYSPALYSSMGTQSSGASNGQVRYVVIDNDQLTGQDYAVEFFEDESAPANELYAPFWKLTNTSTGDVLVEASKIYNFDTTNFAGRTTDGFLTKVRPVIPEIGLAENEVEYTGNKWFTAFNQGLATGIYYVGRDIPQGSNYEIFNEPSAGARSNVIRANKLRSVEIRFGESSKAYRYLHGFIGANPLIQRQSFHYAAAVTAADTVGKGTVGNWDTANDRPNGFVDVPFQVWVVDERYGEERQLAVGFIEMRASYGGNPDGVWDPGTQSTPNGNEAIVIFDADYDPNGGQIEYTGNINRWAHIMIGYELDDPNATQQQIQVAASPWFNAMYIVGLKKQNQNTFFEAGDRMIISLNTYPYTSFDRFVFKTPFRGELSDDDRKALFDKINVFPNPLYGFNPATGFDGSPSDEPFVTFSNLPEEVTIKIFTLSGILIRTLGTMDKSNTTSPFLRWDLLNENGLRAASGLYLAIVSAPGYGEKILKFSIIMPQKQLQRF